MHAYACICMHMHASLIFLKFANAPGILAITKNAVLDIFDDILAGMADSAEKMFFPVRRHVGYPPPPP